MFVVSTEGAVAPQPEDEMWRFDADRCGAKRHAKHQ